MKKPLSIAVGLLWGFFGGVGVATYAPVHAQLRAERETPGILYHGHDVGFRMVGKQGDRPVGQWVVNVDGKNWVVPIISSDVKPIDR